MGYRMFSLLIRPHLSINEIGEDFSHAGIFVSFCLSIAGEHFE
jgi:hypothetical protein